MSRILPRDLTHKILSFLSLTKFGDTNINLWQIRFWHRYGERLNDILPLTENASEVKRLYYLRAASEHSEVSSDSTNYWSTGFICYHAARSHDWNLVANLSDVALPGYYFIKILITAINDDQVDIVSKILIDDSFIRMPTIEVKIRSVKMAETLVRLILSDDSHSESRVFKIFLAYAINYLNYIQYVELLTPYLEQDVRFYNIVFTAILQAGAYNQVQSDHWELIMKKLDYVHKYHVNMDPYAIYAEYCRLYKNWILDVANNTAYDYLIISFFATHSMGERLRQYCVEVDSVMFRRMQHNYQCIPNAQELATETLHLMEQYVEDNDVLRNYIIAIKIITNTVTISDLKDCALLTYPSVSGDIICTLLDNKQYELVSCIDKHLSVKIKLYYYDFTDLDALFCVLRCNNILTFLSHWTAFLTVPLLKHLAHDYPSKIKRLIIDAQAENHYPHMVDKIVDV